ncbi:hypothetical protein PO878_14360 [Iamia majanohamensis]|uniref:Secreted protein n=1 Tax=Iamia majanohamensis TaxID=467976 RepID=A0AAE9Y7E3_9ACTN|nr:hypothetical protein [Iamia majanohamensis]WCO65684.1 hypothetical protein PO878_14360 [Iamia majanohamensis]
MTDARRRGPIVLVLCLVATLVAGCSGADEPASTPDAGTPTTDEGTATQPDPAAPEVFDGSVEDFYVPPDPLPDGEPGDLLRTQAVGTEGGMQTVRIMYLSQDASESLRAVTGIATYPTGPGPDGGRTVVSTAHGTTGIAAPCAPSRTGGAAPAWGVDDVVAVQTDYVGLGPPGELHP